MDFEDRKIPIRFKITFIPIKTQPKLNFLRKFRGDVFWLKEQECTKVLV